MPEISVNGKDRLLPGDLTRPLLEFLRDDLQLDSVREGCGIGMCGTCTVLLEGRVVSSCLVLLGQVSGLSVTTVEGLSDASAGLHPVQQAYLEAHAFQCAFCTPGFVLSTISLLEEDPDPSDEAIRAYLAGNLCRCGSYLNVLKAVRAAARSS